MKVYKGSGDYFVLEVPKANRQAIASLMAYRGLTYSTSKSSPERAILFTTNPYALADMADENCPELMPYKERIEASRALTGTGTRKLPPGCELKDYQKAALDYLLMHGGGLAGQEMGLGKRQPLDEPVLTPDGWKTMGDIRTGDFVIAADGRPTRVVGVFNEAHAPVYKVTFSDGRFVRCDPDHLWEVTRRAADKRHVEVRTAKEMLKQGLSIKSGSGRLTRFYVPTVLPIDHTPKDFDIHPYLLGVLIGDGALTVRPVRFSTPDKDAEIVDYVRACVGEYHLYLNRHPACPQYSIVGKQGASGKAFYHKVRALGLDIKSAERFIPGPYMLGSVEQRYDLLRGLMDTDGSCIRNRTTFHTLSHRLAEDTAQLVRSLGGWAKVRPYTREDKGHVEYQVNVRVPECPFYLTRKSEQWRPIPIRLGIVSIEPDGEAVQRCIKVEHPRQLYVTSGYTLTHNTNIAIAFCNEVEAQRVLVITTASTRIQWGTRIKGIPGMEPGWSTIPNVRVSVMLNVKDGIHPTANYQVISYNAATNPNIIRAISKYKWDVMICDEVHALKSVSALRSRAILGNSRGEFHHGEHKMPAIGNYVKHKIALTGTPLLNRPSEAYNLFRYFDHEAIDFMSEEQFKQTYNRQADIKTITGKKFKLESTSLEHELQNRLRVNIMTRHEKKDIPGYDLPPRYGLVRVEENGAVKTALEAEGLLGLDIDDIQTVKDIETLGHIAEARRLMGEAIAPQVADYAADFLEGGNEKLVIFAWHISVLDILQKALEKYGVVRIDGKKSATAKQKAIADFINDDKVRVFIGNIQAAGTGVDGLQKVCSTCFISEPDWTPSQNEQAVSRLDRIGQANSVQVEIFVAPGSISEKILVRSLEKLNVIHRVLDERKR